MSERSKYEERAREIAASFTDDYPGDRERFVAALVAFADEVAREERAKFRRYMPDGAGVRIDAYVTIYGTDEMLVSSRVISLHEVEWKMAPRIASEHFTEMGRQIQDRLESVLLRSRPEPTK